MHIYLSTPSASSVITALNLSAFRSPTARLVTRYSSLVTHIKVSSFDGQVHSSDGALSDAAWLMWRSTPYLPSASPSTSEPVSRTNRAAVLSESISPPRPASLAPSPFQSRQPANALPSARCARPRRA